jgi:hypothetical protein
MSIEEGEMTREQIYIAEVREQELVEKKSEKRVQELIGVMETFEELGEQAWVEFTMHAADFQDPAFDKMLPNCTSGARSSLRSALWKRGVHVDSAPRLSIAAALLKFYLSDTAPVVDSERMATLVLAPAARKRAHMDSAGRDKRKKDVTISTRGGPSDAQRVAGGGPWKETGDVGRGGQGAAPGGGGDRSDDSDECDSGRGGRNADDTGSFRGRISSRFNVPEVSDEDPSHAIGLFTRMYTSD